MRNLHLARIRGIDLYLHWSWFLVALIEIQWRAGTYSSVGWNVLEYLALFAIVTLHEFGHAFACRSVGGSANRILLWPLGGIAFVDPPPRPGPMLWSIAAGPLVNVALVPVFYLLHASLLSMPALWLVGHLNLLRFALTVEYINLGLLIFNLIPVYPLDGGQVLQSLLWFVLGRARSLMIAAWIGIVGVIAFGAYAIANSNFILLAIAGFVLLECWGGLKHARALAQLGKIPRRAGLACPWCHAAPPLGAFWRCAQCGQGYDAFAGS